MCQHYGKTHRGCRKGELLEDSMQMHRITSKTKPEQQKKSGAQKGAGYREK